jgi:glycerate dehydrogenase
MKIVILDAKTINKGDLSWQEISKIAKTTIYDNSKIEQVYSRCKDADIIITNKVPLNQELLVKLTKLKLICITATGMDIIDLKAAQKHHIQVMNVANYSSYSVAQMVFAHIFHFSQQVSHHNNLVKEGVWSKQENFCFWDKPLFELASLNLAIIGFGNIGQIVAKIGKALGMNIYIYSKSDKKALFPQYNFTNLENLFIIADIITLHCPLNHLTQNLINNSLLKLMKKTALLINSSRGGLVNEEDLAYALNNQLIAGAGLDVLSSEPPKKDNPLLNAKNCIITPHIAWASLEARKRLIMNTAQNIKTFLKIRS